jgi:nucleoside recognition membrane protein YjiH
MKETYATGECTLKTEVRENLLKSAINEGITTAAKSKPLLINIKDAYTGEGLKMATAVMSSILSVGLLGIMLATFTPIFDYVAYIFYPFTLLLRIPEPMLAARATGLGIAEMFLPALLVIEAPLVTKFIVAVMSVSSVLFFSASIPCILSTDIPLSVKDIIIIWFERAVITLILCTPIAYFLL